jgi:DNA-binding LacI/PurR family transcriptional regulator
VPAVVIGDPGVAGGLPAAWTDDAASAREAMEFLAGLDHRVIGHVGGPGEFAHPVWAARGLGVDVPGELSGVAWDDSALCQPALSAMSHDVECIGEPAATAVLGTFEPAGAATVLEAPRARIVARSSTARLVTR